MGSNKYKIDTKILDGYNLFISNTFTQSELISRWNELSETKQARYINKANLKNLIDKVTSSNIPLRVNNNYYIYREEFTFSESQLIGLSKSEINDLYLYSWLLLPNSEKKKYNFSSHYYSELLYGQIRIPNDDGCLIS